MNNPIIAVTILTLKRLENGILSAAYNALTGFDKIAIQNMAYDSFLELSLIQEDGIPTDGDSLLKAMDFVIDERVKDGSFI